MAGKAPDVAGKTPNAPAMGSKATNTAPGIELIQAWLNRSKEPDPDYQASLHLRERMGVKVCVV